MTVHYLPTLAERIWIERASAHAMPASRLTREARFRSGVTDEAVARVLLALERGTTFTQTTHGVWWAPAGTPVPRGLSTAIQEAIRTGLLIHHHTGALVPASVHLGAFRQYGADDRFSSVCGTPGEHKGPKRVRLVTDPIMVDCLACLDRL